MDMDRQDPAFISAGEALVLATAGRVKLAQLVGATIVTCFRRIARHVGPMRGSVTTPRSSAF